MISNVTHQKNSDVKGQKLFIDILAGRVKAYPTQQGIIAR
jgi:hypothetical protein